MNWNKKKKKKKKKTSLKSGAIFYIKITFLTVSRRQKKIFSNVNWKAIKHSKKEISANQCNEKKFILY